MTTELPSAETPVETEGTRFGTANTSHFNGVERHAPIVTYVAARGHLPRIHAERVHLFLR